MKRMTYKGYHAQIMEADRLQGDYLHGLPPGNPLDVYYSEEFIKWPENWMRNSFLVPVRPNKGLWFNWRDNDEINTAIIPTVKGCNPITGMQTSGFHLERYDTKCPKHGCDFQGDRYCPECDYKWPDRNYVSMSPSWWDGFRVGDSVRQFFFTEDELRDVATALIGPENTVPAFGFAFYKPKVPRPPVNHIYHSPGLIGEVDCVRGFSAERVEAKIVKEVSVGAGAKISQALAADPHPLDSWCDAPESVMTIYFVFQEKFEELRAGGMRDLEGKPEGMLSGVPVG